MRRQQLYLIKSQNLHKYNIPEILFNENVVIILYAEFTDDLYRYIHLNNVFLIPIELYDLNKKKELIIEDNEIWCGETVLKNDCTINGLSYLPEYVVDRDEVLDYEAWFHDKVDGIEYETFEDLIPYIDNIPTYCDNFDNLYARISRLRQWGQNRLADRLVNLFNNNEQAFIDVESLSIQTHDFQSKQLDIKIKLDDSVYVYKPNGYHTFIDTITKRYYWHNEKVNNRLYLFRSLVSFPIPTIFFGILNYHLCQNIHKKSTQSYKTYTILLKRLEQIENQNT